MFSIANKVSSETHCKICKRNFSRKYSLKRHLEKIHGNSVHCAKCDEDYIPFTYHNKTLEHKNKSFLDIDDGIRIVEPCFNKSMRVYRIFNLDDQDTVEEFMYEIEDKFKKCIELSVKDSNVIKLRCEMFATFIQSGKNMLEEVKSFNTKMKEVEVNSDLEELHMEFTEEISSKMEDYEHCSPE